MRSLSKSNLKGYFSNNLLLPSTKTLSKINEEIEIDNEDNRSNYTKMIETPKIHATTPKILLMTRV